MSSSLEESQDSRQDSYYSFAEPCQSGGKLFCVVLLGVDLSMRMRMRMAMMCYLSSSLLLVFL